MIRFWVWIFLGVLFAPETRAGDTVIVYTSVDEVLSAPVLEKIAQSTGLDVRPVFDSEATKTTGLYLRLLQERENPRADVFWNSEFSRTLLLEREGLLESVEIENAETMPPQYCDSDKTWTGLSLRARVLCYNNERLSAAEVPTSASALLNSQWKGKVAWADPRFGTTATHCGALLALLGEQRFQTEILPWKSFFHQVRSNGEVARLVAEGVFPLGLTDTDDVWRLKLEGDPIDAVPFDREGHGTLLIPNTVAILKGCPHPEAAKRFVQALLAPGVEEVLAFSTSRQIPARPGVPMPEDLKGFGKVKTLEVGYEAIAQSVDQAIGMMR
jgi:iron(III) transport system substrate-binding protein